MTQQGLRNGNGGAVPVKWAGNGKLLITRTLSVVDFDFKGSFITHVKRVEEPERRVVFSI
jgi:hypothetical protein